MAADNWSIAFLSPTSVTATLGPMLTAVMIEYLFLGMVCYKASAYFRRHFENDGPFIRLIVISVVVLNVFLGITNFMSIYQSTVLDFGDFDKFDNRTWTTWAEPSVTALVALISHVFYIHRCWTVTHSFIASIVLALVALLAFGSGISLSVVTFRLEDIRNTAEARTPAYVWLLSTSICDVCIAFVFVVFWRDGSILRSANAMLSRLRKTAVETGSLTAACALLNLILFATTAPAEYYLLAQCSMSHMYALSVLCTLLGRQELRNILNDGSGTLITGFTQSFLFATRSMPSN